MVERTETFSQEANKIEEQTTEKVKKQAEAVSNTEVQAPVET